MLFYLNLKVLSSKLTLKSQNVFLVKEMCLNIFDLFRLGGFLNIYPEMEENTWLITS